MTDLEKRLSNTLENLRDAARRYRQYGTPNGRTDLIRAETYAEMALSEYETKAEAERLAALTLTPEPEKEG